MWACMGFNTWRKDGPHGGLLKNRVLLLIIEISLVWLIYYLYALLAEREISVAALALTLIIVDKIVDLIRLWLTPKKGCDQCDS